MPLAMSGLPGVAKVAVNSHRLEGRMLCDNELSVNRFSRRPGGLASRSSSHNSVTTSGIPPGADLLATREERRAAS